VTSARESAVAASIRSTRRPARSTSAPDLTRIEAETLVLSGELEAARAGERELLEGIANARLAVVEGAAHFPWIEQPERFRRAVLPCLSG
jgi:proline iminopeptidase